MKFIWKIQSWIEKTNIPSTRTGTTPTWSWPIYHHPIIAPPHLMVPTRLGSLIFTITSSRPGISLLSMNHFWSKLLLPTQVVDAMARTCWVLETWEAVVAPSLSHGSKQGIEAMALFQYDLMDKVRLCLIQHWSLSPEHAIVIVICCGSQSHPPSQIVTFFIPKCKWSNWHNTGEKAPFFFLGS